MTIEPTLSRIPSSNGVTVQVYDYGGDGPGLLFCHATGFCGPVWEPLIAALDGRFRCVAFDFRAHGGSTEPADGDMAWTGMVDDVVAVARTFWPDEPVRAVGHSLGGGTLVLTESAHPGTIHSAWTYEPILFPAPPADEGPGAPHQSFMSDQARRRRNRFDSRDDVYERYRSRPPLDRLDDRCLRAYVQHGFRDLPDGGVELSCSPEYEARTFEQHRTGANGKAGELAVPLAMAVGGEDGRPVEAVVEVAEAHPQLELIRYPELSHFGPLEAPEKLADDIARWFKR